MKEQLIEFETAKLAKEKGFNDHFFHKEGEDSSRWWYSEFCYDPDYNNKELEKWNISNSSHNRLERLISAPTQSLLQKWLRDEHSMYMNITPQTFAGHCSYYKMEVAIPMMVWDKPIVVEGDTYEEVLEKGLQEALKLI